MKSISAAASKLSMPRESHVTMKPKVRIIHVLAPKIIQADVSNFRQIVQRLTGKPASTIERKRKAQDWYSGMKKMKKERKVILHGQSIISGTDYFDGFLELDGLFEEEEDR